jgi:hypothetical protein
MQGLDLLFIYTRPLYRTIFRSVSETGITCDPGVDGDKPHGMGNFYDDIGNIGKSPRVKRRGAANTDPERRTIPGPTFWWWGDGMDMRARLSWQWTMDWPEAVVYESLDPDACYTVRMSGYGALLLRMDGEPVKPPVKRIEIGELIEYPIPPHAVKDRTLVLTWDMPMDEGHLNWRQQSRIAEVWLLKHAVE